MRSREEIIIEGNPGRRINPIYVEDAIMVFESALQLPGSDLINVAGDEVVTVTDLVGLIEKASGGKAVVTHTEARNVGDIVGANNRMKEVLGVYPQTSLLAGLRRMM